MCDTARLYNCARCHKQVIICSHCDRGNIYCNDGCAKQSRQEKQRKAAASYQNSSHGRQLHALRQRRYRQRQKEKVTHQGSTQLAAYDSITTGQKAETTEKNTPDSSKKEAFICHFCGCPCGEHLRWAFLHRQSNLTPPNSVF